MSRLSFFRIRSITCRVLLTTTLPLVGACSLSRLTDVDPPSNLVPPSGVNTQTAAVGLYNGALTNFASAFGGNQFGNPYTAVNGVFSDEFTAAVSSIFVVPFDLRTITPKDRITLQAYDGMQKARLTMDEAIRSLRSNGGTAPSSYIAELYALKGYVYVLMSELFCSGIPFGTTLPDGGIAFGAPRSTTEMLTDAIAQFDSALAITTDSARIISLARVGKGRALLDLGEFDSARVAVASVPTNFTYQVTYSLGSFPNFLASERQAGFSFATLAVPDPLRWPPDGREGGVGLNYATANDVRVAMVQGGPCFTPNQCYPEPAKIVDGGSPIVLADGVEARLIEAEAALHATEPTVWANTLNTLRATRAIPALSADSTTDASPTMREDITFRERAFWMFGTGHRLGDMRRLVRQYHRSTASVFPSGLQPYLTEPPNVYGSLVNIEPSISEFDNNPNYHGCFNRDA